MKTLSHNFLQSAADYLYFLSRALKLVFEFLVFCEPAGIRF